MPGSARIDTARHPREHHIMDSEENLPRPGDPIALLVKQDLDPLSVAELEERIILLEGEIARVKKHMQRAVNHRASADSLFKR